MQHDHSLSLATTASGMVGGVGRATENVLNNMNYLVRMASITCLKELQLKDMRNKSLCYFRDA
jgi:hypothetical protein